MNPSVGFESRTRLPTLTGMRSFAAIAVAIHHAESVWPQIAVLSDVEAYGWIGVPFFFCLSGFVITWSWSRGGGKRFFTKRFARIWPIAVFGLVASVVGYHLTGAAMGGYVGPPRSIVYSALLVQDWFNNPYIRQSWDGVSWSLSAEIFFYAVAPLIIPRILRLSARNCARVIFGLFAVDLATQLLLTPHVGASVQDGLYYNPVSGFPDFVLGACGCRLILLGWRFRGERLAFGVAGALVPLGVYSWLVAVPDRFPAETALVVLPGFLLLILIGAGIDLSGRTSFVSRSLPVAIGNASYALYATHVVLLGYVAWWLAEHRIIATSGVEGQLFIAAFVVLAIALAGVCYVVIERPMQRLILRLLIRDRASPNVDRGHEAGLATAEST